MTGTIIKSVDRLLVRANEPDQLFSVFNQQLLLPAAWPLMRNAFFVSGGLHLGNTLLEIFHLDRQPVNTDLYGLAFEFTPFDESLKELDQRGIPHTPPLPFIYVDSQGWQVTAWHNVFIGGLLDNHYLHRAFFKRSQNITTENWEKRSRPTLFNRQRSIPHLYNTVYRKAITAGIYYNPSWQSGHIRRESTRAGLGISGVYEVAIGTRSFHQTREKWHNLLSPIPEVSDGVWRTPGDLHIRLIPHKEDRLLGMIWQVNSLNRAAQFLNRREMLGPDINGMLTILPQRIGGLDIRIIQ
jgi:hypothetical protein